MNLRSLWRMTSWLEEDAQSPLRGKGRKCGRSQRPLSSQALFLLLSGCGNSDETQFPVLWFSHQQNEWGELLCRFVDDCSGVRCKNLCAVTRVQRRVPFSSSRHGDAGCWGPHVYKLWQLRVILDSALTTSGCGGSAESYQPFSTTPQINTDTERLICL